jgi:hypothetical protein
MDGDHPYGNVITSPGLYLVEWTKSSGVRATDFLLITAINRNALTRSDEGAYYDASDKKIKAYGGETPDKVFKLGNYAEGGSAG